MAMSGGRLEGVVRSRGMLHKRCQCGIWDQPGSFVRAVQEKHEQDAGAEITCLTISPRLVRCMIFATAEIKNSPDLYSGLFEESVQRSVRGAIPIARVRCVIVQTRRRRSRFRSTASIAHGLSNVASVVSPGRAVETPKHVGDAHSAVDHAARFFGHGRVVDSFGTRLPIR
jgi:hypothetical protein